MIIFIQNSKKLFKSLLPIIIFVLIVGGFFWKTVFLNKVPLPGDFITGVYFPWLDYKWGYPAGVPVKNPITADVVSYSYPMRLLGVNLIKSGQLPLWNPYILMGTPLLANFQSAPFSITTIFYYFFDNLTAWSLQVMVQHLLAAIFTFYLLRHWKVSVTGAVFGGLIYAFSGFNLIWSQWNAHSLVASFIPLLLLLSDKLILTGSKKYGLAISVVVLLQIIAGYPQLMLYSFGVVFLLWIVRVREISNKVYNSLKLLLFLIAGLFLSAFEILPGAELLSMSQRTFEFHPEEWAFLPWLKIITFIAPDFFGNHSTGNYWGPQDYTSNTGFVGIACVSVSLIAIRYLFKNKQVLYSVLILISGLMLSFPTTISKLLWGSGFLGFNAAAAHRALILENLGFALLGGIGIDYFLKNKMAFKYLLIPATLLAVFFIHAIKIDQQVGINNLVLPIVVMIGIFISYKVKSSLLIILLALIELFYFGWKFTPFSNRNLAYPETPIINYLKLNSEPVRTTGDKVIPINFRMAYGIETLEGYDAVYPAVTSKYINKVNGSSEAAGLRRYGIVDNDTSPLLDESNVGYVLALKTDKNLKRFEENRFAKVFEDRSVLIFKNLNARNRAYLKSSNGEVKYLEYKETESKIYVNSKVPDSLIISDTWYPGWQAYVDEIPIPIEKENNIFRSIPVTSGEHVVRLIYRPESFYKGLKISILTAIALLIYLFIVPLGKFISRKIYLA